MSLMVIAGVLWIVSFPLGCFASKRDSAGGMVAVSIIWGAGLGFYLAEVLR